MINIDSYINIIDAKNIMNFALYFCTVCIIINFIISFITDIFKRKNEEKNKIEGKSNFNIIEFLGGISID